MRDGRALAPARPARAPALDRLSAVLVALWALASLAGAGALWRYKSTPGAQAETRARWPAGTTLVADPSRPTLLVFVHPCCPCTRATLTELAALLPRAGAALAVRIVSFRPAVPPPAWDESDLAAALASLPGVPCLPDVEGREAARFGATTSGHVLLFGRDGGLRFGGGITGARGHLGDNPGLGALAAALRAELAGEAAAPRGAPVFGCPILGESGAEDRR